MANHDIRKLEHSFNEEFLRISDWLKNNKLSLNSCKTSYILFNRKAHKKTFTISFDSKTLAQVDSVTYLEVILDYKLPGRLEQTLFNRQIVFLWWDTKQIKTLHSSEITCNGLLQYSSELSAICSDQLG